MSFANGFAWFCGRVGILVNLKKTSKEIVNNVMGQPLIVRGVVQNEKKKKKTQRHAGKNERRKLEKNIVCKDPQLMVDSLVTTNPTCSLLLKRNGIAPCRDKIHIVDEDPNEVFSASDSHVSVPCINDLVGNSLPFHALSKYLCYALMLSSCTWCMKTHFFVMFLF